MQRNKKQLEIVLMHYFRNCYSGFPKGKMIPFESPDFIISLRSRNILGVELTRLNPLNALIPDESELRNRDLQEQIIALAQSVFEQSFSRKLFVKFLFADHIKILKERKLTLALQVVQIIRKIVGVTGVGSFFSESVSSDLLPAALDGLLVIQDPVLDVSIWERSNNLGVSENVVADIHEAIRKKDEKLQIYQKHRLNYYWLLITTDRLRGVKSYRLSEKIMNSSFQSRFQQVFLFDLIKSTVFQLV